jgi:2-iminobutanoate/2-iminopropanoate deaminase
VTSLSASSSTPAADKKAVAGATKPIGPYSAGVDVRSLVFVAGQIGMDPATGKFVEGGIEAQTTQVMKNAEAVLENAGLCLEHVVRTTVYLADIADFQAMNGVYATFFPEGSIPPAHSTIGVAALPAGAQVEIDFRNPLPVAVVVDESAGRALLAQLDTRFW